MASGNLSVMFINFQQGGNIHPLLGVAAVCSVADADAAALFEWLEVAVVCKVDA